MTGVKRRWRSRALGVAVLAVCSVVAAFLPPPVETTTAAWVDAEHTSADFTATELLPLMLVGTPRCTVPIAGGLVGNIISFDWTFPDAELYADLDETDVEWTIVAPSGASVTFPGTSTGDTSPPYTMSVGPDLLDRLGALNLAGVVAALLEILLGGDFTVQGRVKLGEWTSAAWRGGEISSVLGLIVTDCVSASGTN